MIFAGIPATTQLSEYPLLILFAAITTLPLICMSPKITTMIYIFQAIYMDLACVHSKRRDYESCHQEVYRKEMFVESYK